MHGCDQRRWLDLARRREATDPLGVIAVYAVEVGTAVDTKSKAGYRNAVKTLARIRELAAAGGAPDRFDEVLASVRSEHRQKRTLMELVDQRGW